MRKCGKSLLVLRMIDLSHSIEVTGVVGAWFDFLGVGALRYIFCDWLMSSKFKVYYISFIESVSKKHSMTGLFDLILNCVTFCIQLIGNPSSHSKRLLKSPVAECFLPATVKQKNQWNIDFSLAEQMQKMYRSAPNTFSLLLLCAIFLSCATLQEPVSPNLSLQNGKEIVLDSLAIAPNNRVLLLGSKKSQEIFLWDSGSGKILSHINIAFQSFAFSKNSRYLAIGLTNGAVIWDLYQNKILHNLTSSIPTGSFVKFSPEGLYLLTGSFRKNDVPMIWDIVNGELRLVFGIYVEKPDEYEDINKLIEHQEFAEAGESLLSDVRPVMFDKVYLENFRLAWAAPSKKENLSWKEYLLEIETEAIIDKPELQKISSELAKKNPTYSGHFQSLSLSSISADKKTFATLDKSGNLHFWNLETLEIKNALQADTSSTVSSFSFVNSENATYLVQVNQQKKESILTLWDLYSSEIRSSFSESSPILDTAIDSKLKKVFYLTKEKLVSVSIENNRKQEIKIPSSTSFAYSESLKQIFVANANSIQIFHSDTFQKLREIKTSEKLSQLEIGTKLLAGLGASKIYIWDLDNDSLLQTITKETAKVSAIKLSKKDSYLGIGFELGAVEVYDAKKGKFVFGSEVAEKKLFTLNKERPNVKEIIDEYFFSNKLQDTYYKLKGNNYIIYTYTQGHRSSVTSLDFSSDENTYYPHLLIPALIPPMRISFFGI